MRGEFSMVNLKILSEADKKLVHKESLRILESVGVRLESETVLSMLKAKGCIVSDDGVVKIPASLIEDALSTAPKKFILGGLDPKNDMYLGEGNSYITTDGQACFAFDYEKGDRRETTLQDLLEAAKLVDSLDYINCFWPIVTAGDMPDESRTLYELARSYSVLGKHFQTDCYSEAQAKYYIRILEAILGDHEKIKKRNIFSVVCCPISPLIFEPEMVEGCIALQEVSVPIVILPMPIAGTTAPMSLFSTVIQNNAEFLAGLTIFQLGKPGSPIIYGSAAGVLDMRTTQFCVGAPECALQNAAACEMSKMYGLPSLISTNASEAKEPDIQCGREKAVNLMTTYMVRPDLICGVGLIETANLYYPELLVLDEDSVGYARRVADGIRGGEEHALTDVLLEVGVGGNFIAEESTVEYLRNGEHYNPVATNRQPYEAWIHAGESVREAARQKAEAIIKEPKESYLTGDIVAKLESILVEAENELGKR
jgi:trimethylamine--corrinoid protein Co-methyltransferase